MEQPPPPPTPKIAIYISIYIVHNTSFSANLTTVITGTYRNPSNYEITHRFISLLSDYFSVYESDESS